jgi:hypothetical protein
MNTDSDVEKNSWLLDLMKTDDNQHHPKEGFLKGKRIFSPLAVE